MPKSISPYVGLTLRKEKIVVNVHDIRNGHVYYGKYDDDALDAPERCIALLRMPLAQFKKLVSKAIRVQGAVVVPDEIRREQER